VEPLRSQNRSTEPGALSLESVAGPPRPDFEAFYAQEWGKAVRLAALLTQSPSAAEDIAQDAFARMLPKWETADNPPAYLRTSIVNTCFQWQRRAGVRREKVHLLAAPTSVEFAGGELADAVASLPHRQRAVLVLRYYADLSEAEIAHALGCQPGTVKSLASRALAKLQREIER